jgi:hypothetical protein
LTIVLVLSILVNFLFFLRVIGISMIRWCKEKIENCKNAGPKAKINHSERSSKYDEENKVNNI